ncbi:MAG: HIT domain-containing protein [Candidatus Binatia bacterium]
MRVLWAPWRLAYVERVDQDQGCIFCEKPALVDPSARREALVLFSDERASVIMNRYPYANAHLMVSPRLHSADLGSLAVDDASALMALLQRAIAILQRAYSPQGFNVGMNLGRCGGAGIDKHLHWHLVPRWEGDTNFMPMLADCRVIPEHLEEAYDRLLPLFEDRGP